MIHATKTPDDLVRDIAELQQRLDEAESTIRAISAGEVDAFVVRPGAEEQVLVLNGVDRPYRLLIERMQQGAITVAADGTILYANQRFAQLIKQNRIKVVGTELSRYFVAQDRQA